MAAIQLPSSQVPLSFLNPFILFIICLSCWNSRCSKCHQFPPLLLQFAEPPTPVLFLEISSYCHFWNVVGCQPICIPCLFYCEKAQKTPPNIFFGGGIFPHQELKNNSIPVGKLGNAGEHWGGALFWMLFNTKILFTPDVLLEKVWGFFFLIFPVAKLGNLWER